tara:strand:+ start:15520 stop:15750 length:231 start_codon:yes stop_codon:yes gene_type:complete
MNKIKTLMLNHPIVSIVLILPFSLVFVFAILDLIINIIIPFMFALWLTGWVFSFITGSSLIKYINKPFWFMRSNRY